MSYDRAARESARRLLPVVHLMKTCNLRIGDVLTEILSISVDEKKCILRGILMPVDAHINYPLCAQLNSPFHSHDFTSKCNE